MQNLRAGAAQAYKTLRPASNAAPNLNSQIPDEKDPSVAVEISNLHFSVDPDKRRAIGVERDRIRDELIRTTPSEND